MELRQLEQFLAVAASLNFRRAAEQLHMSQPPLSVAIRKLEDELGVELFDRGRRGVRLTPAGEATVKTARRCLADADEVRAAARRTGAGESGRLRIGFVGSATYSVLPRLLPTYSRRYPGVELVLTESTNLEILGQVESDLLEVGLVRYPTANPTDLQLELVEADVLHAVLPSAHPLARRRSVTLEALAAEPLIDYVASKVPGLHAVVLLAFQAAGLRPHVAQQATQVQTVISLVESGLGVALVPSVSARLASKGVVFRPISDLTTAAGIGIAIASRRDMSASAAMRFRELATSGRVDAAKG